MSPPRFVIRQIDPGRTRRGWVFAILIWIGTLLMTVVLSSLWLAPRLANTGVSLPVSSMDFDELRNRIAVLERSEQVAKAALGELQGTLRDKDEEIAGLRADLAFYGRLVGGAKREALAVHDLSFAPVAGSNAWNFTATLTQNFKRGQETTGRLTLSVTGIRDGKLETLDWKDLAQQSDGSGIGYAFKYFQKINGIIMLPAGFEPNRVHAVADGEGGHSEQDFPWGGAARTEETEDNVRQ
ncbi:MAG: hypothetical protein EYC71_09060 [Gammaproteobacteria bacterium]|nr:MAG: hypothetical protein EYC71_09060 [Gammaproteobacteria bacterium]